jgi:hypothetical protein
MTEKTNIIIANAFNSALPVPQTVMHARCMRIKQ